ncbi:MAG: AAA family ATPase [Sedimentisphaerales bacterium]|nr:AAA family ATPase [Sedimentisphaerales bacterium]
MLTRLKVSGFKNLVDVDVRFGPFTCIAGPNGVGKSNLFDAIRFLSALADRPLMEAALTVRGDENGVRVSDIRSLFRRSGDEYASEMSFEAEMIVPSRGEDDLGQNAEATNTFLRYTLNLAYRKDQNLGSLGSLEVLKEELGYIKVGEAKKNILFPHGPAWRSSAVHGYRRGKYFISTDDEGEGRVVRLHQDGGSRGRPLWQVKKLNRTVLSTTNTAESPTALLARREMLSWRLLQLEPSALRKPDEFSAPTKLGSNGSHLAATLHRLAYQNSSEDIKRSANPKICALVANRLADLIDDVHKVFIDRDEKRELLTLNVMGGDKTSHPARSLSDGTLRFLALAVLEHDPDVEGVLCLEEPENGIHPARIPAMIQLLRDIAVDAREPIDPDNPLRQVIANTHSPAVVQQVPEDTLLVAEPKEFIACGQRLRGVSFGCLADTWRAKNRLNGVNICKLGDLLAYLNPVLPPDNTSESGIPATVGSRRGAGSASGKRVIDRSDVQRYFPWFQPATPHA